MTLTIVINGEELVTLTAKTGPKAVLEAVHWIKRK